MRVLCTAERVVVVVEAGGRRGEAKGEDEARLGRTAGWAGWICTKYRSNVPSIEPPGHCRRCFRACLEFFFRAASGSEKERNATSAPSKPPRCPRRACPVWAYARGSNVDDVNGRPIFKTQNLKTSYYEYEVRSTCRSKGLRDASYNQRQNAFIKYQTPQIRRPCALLDCLLQHLSDPIPASHRLRFL